jgi:undecaprenyl diphosphate synthase
MAQACKAISERVAAGELSSHDINETVINKHLSLSDFPEPDLFIRTGGEQRVSNFMLWQLAYTELYFTPILWPDFNQAALQEAITSFQSRQRRFGYTGDQIATIANP